MSQVEDMIKSFHTINLAALSCAKCFVAYVLLPFSCACNFISQMEKRFSKKKKITSSQKLFDLINL